ncbi:ATP-binding cassette domain-containing protein [Kitasatospora sp. NPDC056651]|uniref:ATP-binding cassette domain-containing protein n=1 Tax=Kitasatospora sp. NPDC056651 TaxID=3345892 RepID=UPI0036AB81F5
MIQITGLTKVYRKGAPPAVLDLTFDARPGTVTALLGAEGAGKSTALRLMLELEHGQGITLFDGRPYRRIRHPEREVGVLLPRPVQGAAAVAGHPGRKARSHLRMLAAAVGVPVRRADELLEQIRLAGVSGQRLRTFSPGMHRRLALAAALLGDPGTLLLDGPAEGLSPRNVEWFHAFLRSFGAAGGTVLVTTRTPQEASRLADRVVTLDCGRMVADQSVEEFRRTRLSPEVAVRGPQMARLADLLASQGAEVRRDGSVGLSVAGIDRTEIGELAYRHGILLHELADRVVEQPVPRVVLPVGSGRSGRLLHPASEADRSPEPAREPNPPMAIERVSEPAAEPVHAQPVHAGAVTTSAESPTVPAPAEPVAPPSPPYPPTPASAPASTTTATEGAATPNRPAPRRPQDGGSLPVRALPVAPFADSLDTASLHAAGLPVLGAPARRPAPAARRPEPSPQSGPGTAEPAPTVAVDRLFRDDPLPAEAPVRGRAPGRALGRTPGRRAGTDGLLTDDTLRLRPALGATAAQPPAPPAAPAITDDHRSE